MFARSFFRQSSIGEMAVCVDGHGLTATVQMPSQRPFTSSNAGVISMMTGTKSSLAPLRNRGGLGLTDAGAVAGIDQRVPDLDDHKGEFEVDFFFPEGSTVLCETAKTDLGNLPDIARSFNGYTIDISC